MYEMRVAAHANLLKLPFLVDHVRKITFRVLVDSMKVMSGAKICRLSLF